MKFKLIHLFFLCSIALYSNKGTGQLIEISKGFDLKELKDQFEINFDNSLRQTESHWYDSITQKKFDSWYGPYLKVTSGNPIVLKFDILTKEISTFNYVMEIQHADVNYLQLVVFDSIGLVFKSKLVGDRLPFHQRYLGHNFFAVPFELKPDHHYKFFLMLDKPNRVLTARIILAERSFWNQYVSSRNLANGLMFGVFLAFIIIGVLLFLVIKQKQFLYYSFYALSIFFLLFSINGYSYQYLFPSSPEIQDIWIIFVQICGLFFLNLYAFSFLNIKTLAPQLNCIKKVFVFAYLACFVVLIFILGKETKGDLFFGKLLHAIELFNFLLLLLIPIYIYFKNRSQESIVFFVSYFFVGISLFYSIFSFLIPSLRYVMLMDVLPLGLFFEMLILVFYMVFNYQQLSERRIGLENMLSDERRKNQISFIRGQENERSGIAMFIHDHIISEIALIQHSILNASSTDPDDNKESAAKLSILNNELRLLSHELMPESIEKLGLQIALSELLTNYSNDFRVNYFFDNSLNPMKSEVEIAVYRISQELMRNAKNHSRASCVSMQCVKDEENLIYTYEDNGIGIDFSKIQKGLGFRGIEFRSDLLMGSVGYESRMGEGLVVTITIPLL